VSGNVSFYNESDRGAIFPTPAIGMIGIVDDMKRVCTQHFKDIGDAIILLGICREELGGSEYLKKMHNLTKGLAPRMDLKLEKAVQSAAKEAIRRGLVYSAHDCSEGGLAVALAECCISNEERMIGAVVDNIGFKIREDALVFGESQSRIILSCGPEHVKKIRDIAAGFHAPFRVIGRTGGKDLKIQKDGKELINLSCAELSKEYRCALEDLIVGCHSRESGNP